MSKVVTVKYTICEAFKVPKDIDLEDTSQVDYWYVKWNILHIVKTNGEELQVNSQGWIHNADYKNPDDDSEVISTAEEYGLEEEDEEEEEEEEEEEDSKVCVTCGYVEPINKFMDTINGEVVITNECKGCCIEEEE